MRKFSSGNWSRVLRETLPGVVVYLSALALVVTLLMMLPDGHPHSPLHFFSR